MLNTLTIFHELQETLDTRAAEKIAEIIGKVYDELHNTVTKEEFRELTQVVRELGEAQKRSLLHFLKRRKHLIKYTGGVYL